MCFSKLKFNSLSGSEPQRTDLGQGEHSCGTQKRCSVELSCRSSASFLFAAYAAYTDHEIGRVIQEVQDEGKLDNTVIIYISGDNGTSAEGTLGGYL